jgi:uncharacterized protein
MNELSTSLLAAGLIAAASAATAQSLPRDVDAAIRKDYVWPDLETRYLDGSIDLNADGKPELIVHVVGPMACGTGGCPTMVFTPSGSGYRLVTTISVSNPPVRASLASTQGWRNLIVHVSGGGAEARDVELLFDGKSYPRNPTVPGTRVKSTTANGGDVVIKAFDSFEQTKVLPKQAPKAAEPSAPAAKAVAGGGPSFDCTKASNAAEKAVCGDGGLSALDRSLAEAWAKALKSDWPDDYKARQRTTQRAWLTSRNACVGATDPKACLDGIYRRRLIEIQITSGQLEVPKTVAFTCTAKPDDPFTAVFYNQTDPKSATLTWGDRQVIAFAAQTGNGSRYQAPGVDYLEHQGEAAVRWADASFTCKPLR